MPGLVTDLLTNITTQWVQLSNGMIVTPGHLFARPQGGFMSIADVLRLDGHILDAHGQVQTVTGSWIHYSADTAEQFETAAVQVLPHHGSTALEPQMVVGWRTYNFTVSDTHTYIAHDVRVHNDSQWQERYEAYLADSMLTPEQLSYEAWKAEYAIQDGPPVGPNGEGSDAPVNGPTDPEDTGDTGDSSAGYNGPSQEYSPGDIDPVTGRVITSVDEDGNITGLAPIDTADDETDDTDDTGDTEHSSDLQTLYEAHLTDNMLNPEQLTYEQWYAEYGQAEDGGDEDDGNAIDAVDAAKVAITTVTDLTQRSLSVLIDETEQTFGNLKFFDVLESAKSAKFWAFAGGVLTDSVVFVIDAGPSLAEGDMEEVTIEASGTAASMAGSWLGGLGAAAACSGTGPGAIICGVIGYQGGGLLLESTTEYLVEGLLNYELPVLPDPTIMVFSDGSVISNDTLGNTFAWSGDDPDNPIFGIEATENPGDGAALLNSEHPTGYPNSNIVVFEVDTFTSVFNSSAAAQLSDTDQTNITAEIEVEPQAMTNQFNDGFDA